jgi:hypothetical protein
VELVGSWTIDLLSSGAEAFGDVSMEFTAGGDLIYTVHRSDADQIAMLTWRLEGDVLVTDQPSTPREERTHARIDEAGRLILGSPGDESVFIRLPAEPDQEPA